MHSFLVRRRFLMEFSIFILFGVILFYLFKGLDLLEYVYWESRKFEHVDLDEIVMVVFVFMFVSMIFLVKRNIEVRRLNKKLKSTQLQLNDSLHMKDRLFTVIGHDLRAPFNSLIGFSELMMMDKDAFSAKHQQFVNIISSTARNTYSVLSNLLDWAKDETKGFNLQPASHSLNNLVRENINLLVYVAQDKRISLTYQTEEDLLVYCDYTTISAVIRNLISNAIKFTPAGGSIQISSGKESSQVWLSVKDNGIGISEDALKKINSNTIGYSTPGTAGETGTGLGLALCKRFLDYNRCTLAVNSKMDKETCFTITFPTV